jgi:hypothetical protein
MSARRNDLRQLRADRCFRTLPVFYLKPNAAWRARKRWNREAEREILTKTSRNWERVTAFVETL